MPQVSQPADHAEWSTSSVSPPEAFDYWRDMICATFVQLAADPVGQGPFAGKITHAKAGDIELSTVHADGQHVRRTRSLIARSHEEYVLASIQLDGAGRIEQDDRIAELSPGSMAFYDSTRPYTLYFDRNFTQLVVQVPRGLLLEAAGTRRDTGPMTARRIGPDGPCGVVADFFASLARTGYQQRSRQVEPLLPHAIGLLGSAFCWARNTGSAAEQSPELRRERVLAYLHRNLSDPELDVDRIAAACHMSRRSLYRLFQGDRGVAERLRLLRLERAKAMLLDEPERPVHAIARVCGFDGDVQFYRAFRAAVGCTPSEYRAAAREPGGTHG